MAFASIDGGGGGGSYSAPRPKPKASNDPFGGLVGAIAKAAPAAVANPAGTIAGNNAAFSPIIDRAVGGGGSGPSFGPPTDGGVTNFNPDIGTLDLGGVNAATPATPVIDFNAILQKALANLGYANIDNSLQKAREQLIIRYGDPTLASMAGFGLDPQAGAFAQQNYLSGNADLARLDKQRKDSQQSVINRLAAHGILNSGDLGYGLNQAESAYGNSRYDLTQQYLQQLQALLDNSLQQKQQLRSSVVNALLSAYGNSVQDPNQLIGLYAG